MNPVTNNDKQSPGNAPGGDDQMSIPLSFEDGKEAITVAQGSSRRRLGFGALLFTSVAAIAVISLFSMRAIGRAGAAPTVVSDAESLVEKFLNEREGKQGQSLSGGLLDVDGTLKTRIPTEELKKNPFILIGEEMVLSVRPSHAMKVVAEGEKPPVDESPLGLRGSNWDALCAAAAAAVRVQSAMVSSNPSNSMAHINGQVLRIGETVTVNGSTAVFTIKEITKDGVLLRAWSDDLQREATFRVPVGN